MGVIIAIVYRTSIDIREHYRNWGLTRWRTKTVLDHQEKRGLGDNTEKLLSSAGEKNGSELFN